MHCPFCEHAETKVIDSRLAGEPIYNGTELPELIEAVRGAGYEPVVETERQGQHEPRRAAVRGDAHDALAERAAAIERLEVRVQGQGLPRAVAERTVSLMLPEDRS